MKHIADGHDVIQVRGARENNLRDVSLDVPKRRLTVFTGVSGSGKSSLVFGTIAAESQRMINETYSAFLQSFMGSPARPDVDALHNLSAAIVVDQERMGANARSTLGTATDAYTLLRIIFSRLGTPGAGSALAYSFNAEGMCPGCEGLGKVSTLDIDQLVDRSKSINEGAITVPNFSVDGWYVRAYAESGLFDPDKPVGEFSEQELHDFLHRSGTKVKVNGINTTYEGLVVKVQRMYLAKDRESVQPHIRAFIDRAATFASCADCGGARLKPAVLDSRIDGRNIAECSAMQVSDLAAFLSGITAPGVGPVVATLRQTLDSLVEIGLGYLSLDRESGTLSGGEAQRVKMVRHLGSSLTDITYVFDEPTVGLHPHDIQRMNSLLLRLRDKGNTVLVVEHKPETIFVADHVVDIGPGAGPNGGRIQFEGTVSGLRASSTLTGRYLGHRVELKKVPRDKTGDIAIRQARTHNLQDVDVDVPTGVLTVVTGVAGSGKSSLVHGSIGRREGVIVVDQSAIRGSRRSNPATYTGLLDAVRAAFAKANKVKPALFSANSEGACPNCKGIGLVYVDLAMMAGVASVCEECEGRRFTAEVLEYKLRDRDISQVLAMPVSEAVEFFTEKAARTVLERLSAVGLGYITLGQPLNTLSGGERQRLKLAVHMGGGTATYLLDEPTSGLHLADVDQLLALLDRLVDSGNTVVVIEHHLAVMAHADWIIDLGPGAGHDGGRVVFTGTPTQLVEQADTVTAQHLRGYVS
ncbi:ATP-binding cassette domain-containing protein [Actinoplanes couchii]|uniref:UvrABC system protein A n=1 Tax=Actinoplanes couchii TaxID=403638 RepID=A0ABQ3X1B2_9ACTN|nr:excinuclease ABC subunit UvrA [Actinoplanes couchii]MDR6316712.1 excinuclease UvrABC ATPase subunit [Actinoplanes couchii]GID52321.1 excinuclease ABC subunit A [Actinoplanes couchii]